MTYNRLSAMSLRGFIKGFDQSFFGGDITTRSRDTRLQNRALL